MSRYRWKADFSGFRGEFEAFRWWGPVSQGQEMPAWFVERLGRPLGPGAARIFQDPPHLGICQVDYRWVFMGPGDWVMRDGDTGLLHGVDGWFQDSTDPVDEEGAKVI